MNCFARVGGSVYVAHREHKLRQRRCIVAVTLRAAVSRLPPQAAHRHLTIESGKIINKQ